MEAEVVEVDVPPATAALVDQPDEHLTGRLVNLLEVDRDPFHGLGVLAGDPVHNGSVRDRYDLDRGRLGLATADEEAGEAMGDLKRYGSQGALPRVRVRGLVATGPVLAVVASLVLALRVDGGAPRRVVAPGVSLHCPVFVGPLLEPEVQGFAVRADRHQAVAGIERGGQRDWIVGRIGGGIEAADVLCGRVRDRGGFVTAAGREQASCSQVRDESVGSTHE